MAPTCVPLGPASDLWNATAAEMPQLQQAQLLLEHSPPTPLHRQVRGMLMVWEACPFPQKDNWSLPWTVPQPRQQLFLANPWPVVFHLSARSKTHGDMGTSVEPAGSASE